MIKLLCFFFSFLLLRCVLSVSLHHRFSLALLQQQAKQGSSSISHDPEDIKRLRPIKKTLHPPLIHAYSTRLPSPSQGHIRCTPAQLATFHKPQGLRPHNHEVWEHQGGAPGAGGRAVLLRRLLEELVLEIHACSCCSPLHALACLPPDFL